MEQKKSRFKKVIRVVIFLLAAAALAMMFVDDLRHNENDPPAAQLLPDQACWYQRILLWSTWLVLVVVQGVGFEPTKA